MGGRYLEGPYTRTFVMPLLVVIGQHLYVISQKVFGNHKPIH